MKSFLSVVLKLLGIFVLGAAALVVVLILLFAGGVATVVHQVAKQQAVQEQAIKVLRMYASPQNPTLAERWFVVKNTSNKTISAIKFRVVVYNKLKERVDDTTVQFEKSIVPNAVVYCNVYTLFDADSGLPTESGCNVDSTDQSLLDLAKRAGCKPQQLEVHYRYKVKVLFVAY